ncbi:MAG: hypothetical protein ABR529_11825 [Actinomycetota bacterium]
MRRSAATLLLGTALACYPLRVADDVSALRPLAALAGASLAATVIARRRSLVALTTVLVLAPQALALGASDALDPFAALAGAASLLLAELLYELVDRPRGPIDRRAPRDAAAYTAVVVGAGCSVALVAQLVGTAVDHTSPWLLVVATASGLGVVAAVVALAGGTLGTIVDERA